jgi:predicted RNA binding protein YcfA (HicA-like mRNA interferase family)
MRIPRDISGAELIKRLKPFGYSITRQTGSHIRLTTEMNGVHRITIPDHKPLRIVTISSILTEVSGHFNLSREELVKKLFFS